MKKTLPFLLLFLVCISCKEKGPNAKLTACGVNDPVRNLPWLRDLVNEARSNKEERVLTITLVELAGEPVINYYLSYYSCIGCISYRCDGTRIDLTQYSEAELKEYRDNIWGDNGDRVILWPEK